MSVDIRWCGLIENYLKTGDMSTLEKLIREEGVPAQFGNQIADLLIARNIPLSIKRKQMLKSLDFAMVLLMNKKMMQSLRPTKDVHFKVPTMQSIAERIFPNYSPADARRAFNRLRKKNKI